MQIYNVLCYLYYSTIYCSISEACFRIFNSFEPFCKKKKLYFGKIITIKL